MIRIIVLALLLAATSAQAGFKMFVPNGAMNSSETDEERATRETNEAEYRRVRDELREQTARHANPPRTRPTRIYSQEELLQGKPYDGPTNVRGPRPGGHRRHLWREQTGVSTPAERTRYRMEVYRLKQELKKERARPNPAGDHPTKIRKSLGIKL